MITPSSASDLALVQSILPANEAAADRGGPSDPWATAFCNWCGDQIGVGAADVATSLFEMSSERRAAVGSPIGWAALARMIATEFGLADVMPLPVLH